MGDPLDGYALTTKLVVGNRPCFGRLCGGSRPACPFRVGFRRSIWPAADHASRQSVGAQFAHLKFVNTVRDKIGKIALVTDIPMRTFADHVLDPLMLARVRKFDDDGRDQAMSWLRD